LKELIDALSDISSSLQLLPRQNELISIEVASISDKPSLELLEAALGAGDAISDAASQRLVALGEARSMAQSGPPRTGTKSDGSKHSFQTALSHMSPPNPVDALVLGETTLLDDGLGRAAESSTQIPDDPQHKEVVNQEQKSQARSPSRMLWSQMMSQVQCWNIDEMSARLLEAKAADA